MSVATRFKYYRPFPVCPSASVSGFDYVDITLAQAMALWWNLEEIEVVTTGSKTDSFFNTVSINWTTKFGPVESLPFTPTASTRAGSYYNGANPARAPNTRVCYDQSIVLDSLFRVFTPGTSETKKILFRLLLDYVSENVYRLFYQFEFSNIKTEHQIMIAVTNPEGLVTDSAWAGYSGTPASTGTVSVLGISLNWVGGGADTLTKSLTAETASMSVTSAAFTY